MPGTLYVVATPIGNLEDLTFRALRTLREVDLIAAEDTRRTAKLLGHYDIHKSIVSLREHNELRETPRLIDRLQRGERIALVSDAGTPGIADPGARLVRAAREAAVPVVPIPGPSAVTAALSVAGITASEFVFMGFPPPAGTARREWFERLERESRTVVFFEAPHRISRTLADLSHVVERPIQIHRELTKIHEEYITQPNSASLHEQGEFVVIVEPNMQPSSPEPGLNVAAELIGQLIEGTPMDQDRAVAVTAAATGVLPRTVRKILKKRLIAVKRQNLSDG